IPTSLLVSSIQLLIAEAVFQSIRPYPLKLYEAFKAIQFSFAFNFQFNLLTYWVILGIGYSREYYKKFRDRELRATQLEAQLSQAQLQALKMQLHPHFFFNTLNTISSLMHKNVHDADRVLARLGDLLRYSLRNVGIQEVTLKEELEFLQRYLEIEQIRFGERLKIQIMIDQSLSEAKVPNLILQPLVENAIRYAVGPRTSGGKIEISAVHVNGNLQLSVMDDGPGLPKDYHAISSEGVGLRNTRERLEQLYGDRHEFKLTSNPQCGLNVNITIPFHTL
ncbi:MAG: histidine kinase, partial [Ignavibacteriales bacterium]|nr:histidine kinase [Ignavibacteriales bacterium]